MKFAFGQRVITVLSYNPFQCDWQPCQGFATIVPRQREPTPDEELFGIRFDNYRYTSPDDCHPVSKLDGRHTTISGNEIYPISNPNSILKEML